VTKLGYGEFSDCSCLTGVYFKGGAPTIGGSLFNLDTNATVYYLAGTTGWGTTFGGRPTALWWVQPSIQTPPKTQTAEAGATVDFWVDAAGEPPPSCQWCLNGTNMLSCANNELVLTNIPYARSGTYTVIVTNVFGAVTSAPVTLNVIAPVPRRRVPGVNLTAQAGNLLGLDYRDTLGPATNWETMATLTLSNASQFYFDVSQPLPTQRFYRAWQTGTPAVVPSLDLHMVPAITLAGNVGDSLRLDYINQIGPIDAWVTLGTVKLTNSPQLYFDVSEPGQPPRLYRIVQMP